MPVSEHPKTAPSLRWSDIRAEVRPTLALGWPVVVGQLGFMLMNVVDTAMVKPLGPAATAAVGLGGGIGSLAFMFGLGMLLGLDRVVSFAWGAGRIDDCHRSLIQGLWIAVFLSLPIMAAMHLLAATLHTFGVGPDVAPNAAAYLRALSWSTLPGLLFTALRQALQATGDTRFPSVVMIGANLVNVGANFVLIFGAFGFPALGVVGAGWATFTSRLFMFLVLAVYTLRRGLGAGKVPENVRPSTPLPSPAPSTGQPAPLELATTTPGPESSSLSTATRWARVSLLPHGPSMRELLVLGLPVAFHLVLESGVFTMATILAARLGTVELAAHHIVLLVSSLTFMVPLGLSTAGAVRVGQALGRGDPWGARNAGWAAVTIAVLLMAFIAALILVLRGSILGIFVTDPDVIGIGRVLLLLVAVYQMADGAQITLSAVLRGTGDTRVPALANLLGHWGLGLPLGATLCFVAKWGTVGLWTGLAVGLLAVASLLTWWWRRRINHIAETTGVELPSRVAA